MSHRQGGDARPAPDREGNDDHDGDERGEALAGRLFDATIATMELVLDVLLRHRFRYPSISEHPERQLSDFPLSFSFRHDAPLPLQT